MSNTIQIKTGSGKPANGKLIAGELGYDKTNGYLYIGNASNQTVGMKVEYATSAGSATSATNATNATNATYATSAGNADTVDGFHFHWSGQSGQPNWLWGGTDGKNMYVYNPSNFSVNYAKTAGSATSATSATSAASAEKLSANGGSNTQPVYFTGGKPVICTGTLSNSISGTAAYADKLNANAGSATKPIYFSGGKPAQCNDTIAVNITGNAATATSATSATSATTATTATKLSSTLAVGSGGTGATTAAAARVNLGLKYTQILAAGSWATSCSWSGDFDFIIGLAAPDNDSTMSKVSFVIPKAFLGSTFQVADDTTYSAFSTAATSITYSKGHQGRLSCVFGVKVG